MGDKLIFMEDIERMTGWSNETVRHYASSARRARREGNVGPEHMPEEVDKVRRELTKSDGRPLVVWTPRWREQDIIRWLAARGGTRQVAREHEG